LFDTDEASHPNVVRVLRNKFDRWTERVDVHLVLCPEGWAIMRATATLPGGLEGDQMTESTSRIVAADVREVLAEAREPVAP
jgi:hypothetical protein